jgi:hypothetical protein
MAIQDSRGFKGMYSVELYSKIRHSCHVEGMSIREDERVFEVHRKSVRKMLQFSIPPGYRREQLPKPQKLDGFTGIIDGTLQKKNKNNLNDRTCKAPCSDRIEADEIDHDGSPHRPSALLSFKRGQTPLNRLCELMRKQGGGLWKTQF